MSDSERCIVCDNLFDGDLPDTTPGCEECGTCEACGCIQDHDDE